MGVDHNVYIGPYVRVTETVVKKKGDYCEDHNRGNAPYCPQCGRSKADRKFDYEDNGAPDDWQEEYNKGSFYDYMFSTSVMSGPDIVKGKRTEIYLPNQHYEELNIPNIDGDKYSEEEIPFEEMNVAETIKQFKKLFKDEIEYMEQWFELEIKYGYVSWCS